MKKLFPIYFIFLLTGCGKNTYIPEKKVEISKVIEYTSLTITNYTNSSVNLSGWKLTEEISFMTVTHKHYTFQAVTIASGASVTFTSSQLGFRLQKPDEMLYLYNQSGQLVDQMSWMSFD